MSEITYVDGWPQPYPQMDAAPYWEALARRELTVQRCTACARIVWPAGSHCPDCGTKTLDWVPALGRGRVWSHSTVHRGPTTKWQEIAPYTVGFVEMEEGYHLFTQIDAAAEAIAIGTPVQVRFVTRGAQVLPVFVPV